MLCAPPGTRLMVQRSRCRPAAADPAIGAMVLLLAASAAPGLASASPAEVAARLAAPGAWAFVDESGAVRPSGSFTGVPPDDALTAAGLAMRERFDFTKDDPVLGCGSPGMPRALTAASPMTFTWNEDQLVIRYESMDVVRTVFMSTEQFPAATERSPNGYARGHWEADDTLVIETSHLDGRIQDLLGTPKSPDMTLEERYEIEDIAGETRLHLDLIMTDPAYLVEPYIWRFEFVLKPDWALLEYSCEERPAELTPGAVPND